MYIVDFCSNQNFSICTNVSRQSFTLINVGLEPSIFTFLMNLLSPLQSVFFDQHQFCLWIVSFFNTPNFSIYLTVSCKSLIYTIVGYEFPTFTSLKNLLPVSLLVILQLAAVSVMSLWLLKVFKVFYLHYSLEFFNLDHCCSWIINIWSSHESFHFTNVGCFLSCTTVCCELTPFSALKNDLSLLMLVVTCWLLHSWRILDLY